MKNFYSLKYILLFAVLFTLLFVQVSSETNNSIEIEKNAQLKATIASRRPNTNTFFTKPISKKQVKTVTPKKYRKNFVIRIPKTIFKPSGPKRITITKTTPPATLEPEIPTHTAGDETTTYYSTFGFDFISPSPQLSRIYRTKKSPLTRDPLNEVSITKVLHSKETETASITNNDSKIDSVTKVHYRTETIPVTKAP
ncbi:hypothetical protein BCR36DRAFT_342420 [Piromyces finnis]|uniref:Uncharacterized protein n=1 Tax=Piromyces finnis TaxID=1754191 RepID=A0A1Y1VMD8_9FUNG|nr:hypothetical protein BCR36DRAFT_342420 [Piromyces finnis]|eukprot:ORX60085.1 hypothetical protein BCR36DRAFT_342420 [Piromyces finnis]